MEEDNPFAGESNPLEGQDEATPQFEEQNEPPAPEENSPPAPAQAPVIQSEPVSAPVPAPRTPPVKPSKNDAFPSSFDISVSDPEKKGDGMNAFMVYNVNTKTTSTEFQNPSMTVSRRFNNFVWLYEQLVAKHPGIIVPPIPEKQALGRFDSGFIDHRRSALEKCLRRIGAHPILSKSPEFKLFLESKDLEGDIKKREPKKSLFSTFSDVVQTAAQALTKFPEEDEWFENKRSQLETLENRLKALLRCTEIFVKQRKDLSIASKEFGESSSALGSSEFNKSLGSCLVKLGELQQKVHEIVSQQANSDEEYIQFTVEEYLRIITSAKMAMEARTKSFSTWKSNDAALQKKKEQLAKLAQQPKNNKTAALEKEIEEAEKATEKAKASFDEITQQLREELGRFDREKIEDFQQGLVKFTLSMIENQKKIISLWDGYLPEVQSL